jgi:hypothetical protein
VASKFIPGFMHTEIDKFPIIQPGALNAYRRS